MPALTHRFEEPDRFVAGTIGPPGERTFFVQARQGNRLASVVCEKQQVAVLAEHLERILDELTRISPLDVPPRQNHAVDLGPLDLPLDEDFRIGTMTLAWDSRRARVQIEMFSVESEDDDADLDAQTDTESDSEQTNAAECLIVGITPGMARDFAARARALVSAGRPPCPFCDQPINPSGHICPRANGLRSI